MVPSSVGPGSALLSLVHRSCIVILQVKAVSQEDARLLPEQGHFYLLAVNTFQTDLMNYVAFEQICYDSESNLQQYLFPSIVVISDTG